MLISVYIYNVREYWAYIYTYGVGYGVVCSVIKAIPEPLFAEQQDCSPAFLFVFSEQSGNQEVEKQQRTTILTPKFKQQ